MANEKDAKAKKATVKLVGLPKVKKVKREPTVSVHDSKYIGSEPTWEKVASFSDQDFDNQLRRSFKFYNYVYTQRELKKYVVSWAQKNMKLSKEQTSTLVLAGFDLFPMTVCSLIKAEIVGMPMRKEHKDYVVSRINNAIVTTQQLPSVVEKVTNKETYIPTIQDRLAEKTAEIIGEIEGQVDNVFKNLPTIDIYAYITERNLAHAQVGKVRSHFQKQIDELTVAFSSTDEQLVEAYSFMKTADIRRVGAFYVKLLADFDSYVSVKRAVKKVKAKKAPNKDKIASKVKFLKESKELKVVSAPITSIIGAQVVWVFNVKTRKLGKYSAQDSSVLGLKGTSITGFDETKSVQKTLRKPMEQIRDFMKLGKVALRTVLTDIKAVETRLNGRLSADILVLKIE